MEPYILVTERLGLRQWVAADLQPFIDMNADPVVMKYFPATLTSAETTAMLQRIRHHFDIHHFGLFAVENKATQEFIGFTGFAIPAFESSFTPCVEIGWRYKKEAWGKGFATEAASACMQYGFEVLGLPKIVSFTAVLNIHSEKVMKRIGMQYVTDFDHPAISINHALCRHRLYEMEPGNAISYSAD